MPLNIDLAQRKQFALQIFDVEHGFSALFIAPSGESLLIDCGHNVTTGFRPSLYLPQLGFDPLTNRLSALAIANMDEDHVSDFLGVLRKVNPRVLYTNPSVTADVVYAAKREGGVGTEVEGCLAAKRSIFTHAAGPIDWGGAMIRFFWLQYPLMDDTNNLSLVTYVECGSARILFPGDLERAGWEWMLYVYGDAFKGILRKTNVFVASHHGREGGLCESVFQYCSPEIVVVSDEAVKYDSQASDYGRFSRGLSFTDGRFRKVVSTRNNGHIVVLGGINDVSWLWISKR